MTTEMTNPIAPMAPYAHNEDISLTDDIKLSALDKMPNLQKDEVARISIVSFNDEKNPRIKFSQYFFDSVANFGFLAPVNKVTLDRIVAKLGEPKVKFGTIIVKYTTDRMGNLQGNPPGFTFYAWLFGTDKFRPLKALHKEWNLFGRDLIITCQDDKFQKFVIAPAQECVWQTLPGAENVLEMGNNLYAENIGKFFNKEVPDNELFVKLGFVAAGAPMIAASPFNASRSLGAPAANPANAFSTLVKNPGTAK